MVDGRDARRRGDDRGQESGRREQGVPREGDQQPEGALAAREPEADHGGRGGVRECRHGVGGGQVLGEVVDPQRRSGHRDLCRPVLVVAGGGGEDGVDRGLAEHQQEHDPAGGRPAPEQRCGGPVPSATRTTIAGAPGSAPSAVTCATLPAETATVASRSARSHSSGVQALSGRDTTPPGASTGPSSVMAANGCGVLRGSVTCGSVEGRRLRLGLLLVGLLEADQHPEPDRHAAQRAGLDEQEQR